jgi:endonuclease/exonuclease/phosphatase family metal-dependent hydrolase
MFVKFALIFLSLFSTNALLVQNKFDYAPAKPTVTNPVTLRLMTFNLWNSGENVKDGMQKIVNHILEVNPDIAALEEIESTEILYNITTMLGPPWIGTCNEQGYPDTAIITRHKFMTINDSTADHLWQNGATRSKIQMIVSGGQQVIVNFWALHLAWETYGPYAACNKAVTETIQIESAEAYLGGSSPGRIQNAHAIVSDPYFQQNLAEADREPMFVLGDMNTPSHLDWTSDLKAKHCGWEFLWPATKIFYMAGLTDAYRTVNPDPGTMPGNTWSTVTPYTDGWQGMIPEPQDRIDMIHYKSTQWVPVDAQVYVGAEPIIPKPNYQQNDWPSDHASVYADFQLKQ